jgi:hypothetical protein
MPPSACPFRSNPDTIADRNARMLNAIGRLRPGVTLDRAQNDLTVVTGRLNAAYPDTYEEARTGFRTAAVSVEDELTRGAKPTLLILLATTGFVLLLVAANVANLALARVMGRERELAVRGALGAGRGRSHGSCSRKRGARDRGRRARLACAWLARPARVLHRPVHAAAG